MANILDLARLAQFAYEPQGKAPPGWIELERIEGRYGFRAVAYVGAGETVVAFRGTNLSKADLGGSAGDVAADAMLGIGMNTSHFGQAEDFVERLQARGQVTLTGHSLGGAIAQIVGNRGRLPFATFNAPGVAVVASRNMVSEGVLATTVLRLGGALLSSAMHPVQAWRDVRSTFYKVAGVNVRLTNDLVSMIGVHYGKVLAVPGTRALPEHSIDTVVAVLETNPTGRTTINAICGT